MNIIIDGNYIFHKTFSLFVKMYRDKEQDPCELLLKTSEQNRVMHKFVTDMCASINRFKDVQKVVIVFDSHSWRYRIFDNYKYALTRVREPHFQYFLEILDRIEALLKNKGFIVSRMDGMEGDDFMYFWAYYFDSVMNEQAVIITSDSDIRQLITPKISVYGNNSKYVKMYCHSQSADFWENYFDGDMEVETVEPMKILLSKAILGDGSDNVPKYFAGFGEVAFDNYFNFVLEHYNLVRNDYVEDVVGERNVKGWARFIVMTIGQFNEKYFVKVDTKEYDELVEKLRTNIHLTWLHMNIYDETIPEFIQKITEHLVDVKDKFSYKLPYKVEHIINTLIK